MAEPLPSTQLRCYCDGELTPAERTEIEQRLACCAQSRAVVEFEQSLRQRVAESMAEPAPRDLESRVRTALAGDQAASPRRRGLDFFAGPTHANVFAVAACLLLVAGAVLVGIFGRPIDRFQPGERQDAAGEAASFASTEHARCAGSDEARGEKLLEHSPAEAAKALSQFLDASVEVPDLTGIGYEFIGAGSCHVPGFDRSVHLFYRRVSAEGRAMGLSLFVGRAEGPFYLRDGPSAHELRPGQVHPFPPASACREGRLWTDGSTVRMLVCCNVADLPKALQLVKPLENSAD